MKLLLLFIILNIANVILQTVKSIATIKCGKFMAAVVNAIAYGLYTIVLVYTNSDLNLWAKVIVVAAANLIGVYVVKYLEEKVRKDKLWKIEATFSPKDDAQHAIKQLKLFGISYNYIEAGKYTIINCFCETQKQSAEVKEILDLSHAKYFVSESKIL